MVGSITLSTSVLLSGCDAASTVGEGDSKKKSATLINEGDKSTLRSKISSGNDYSSDRASTSGISKSYKSSGAVADQPESKSSGNDFSPDIESISGQEDKSKFNVDQHAKTPLTNEVLNNNNQEHDSIVD